MLSFDPSARISVTDALSHPWLASYHDVNDEPVCPEPFKKWHEIEQLETLEQFREALWKEIENYRMEVRGMCAEVDYLGKPRKRSNEREERLIPDSPEAGQTRALKAEAEAGASITKESEQKNGVKNLGVPPAAPEIVSSTTPTDPLMTYAKRSSIMGPSRQSSTFSSPMVQHQHLPTFAEGPMEATSTSVIGGGVDFPSHARTESYVLPARSRTSSTPGGEVSRTLLRTLSTVSIHESIEALPGGLPGVANIREYIVGKQTTGADAPPSEIPRDFDIVKDEEDNERRRRQGCKFHIG